MLRVSWKTPDTSGYLMYPTTRIHRIKAVKQKALSEDYIGNTRPHSEVFYVEPVYISIILLISFDRSIRVGR